MRTGKYILALSAMVLICLLGCQDGLNAQTAGLGLNPARMEVEIMPGGEKTVSFRIESPPAPEAVRGRLLLTPYDWTLDEDGVAQYASTGSLPNSASSWIVFSPAAVSISSGQTQPVRVTVRVPSAVQPGVYRTSIFVDERPPAAAPNLGQHVFYLRFRYVFTLYVIVPPVSARGELMDVRLGTDRDRFDLIYEMKNDDSLHLRPRVSWVIKDEQQKEISVGKNQESTVLLPFAALRGKVPVAKRLSSGKYEVTAEVDFHDGRPVQAIHRSVEITEANAANLSSSDAEKQPPAN